MLFHHRVGKADAIGRQDAGKPVDEDGGNSQDSGNSAGMLGPCPTECGQYMLFYIKAAHHRYLADGPHHDLIGHIEKPKRGFFNCQRRLVGCGIKSVDPLGHLCHGFTGGLDIKGQVFTRAKDMGKIVGLQPPKDKVGIGDGQVAVFPVADRTGMSAGRFRPDLEHTVFKKQARAASCRHGPDIKLGRLNANARCPGFKGQLQFTAIAGDIG